MAFGFMANTAAVTGISNFYDATKGILLKGSGTVDDNARVMPQATYISQVDVLGVANSGSPRCLKVLLTWDSAGDDQLFRETEGELLVAGVTTSSKNNVVIPIRTVVRAPSTQTNLGEVYAWVKVDKGTYTVSTVRLHWATKP